MIHRTGVVQLCISASIYIPLTEMNDFVMAEVVAQYAPHAAAIFLALCTNFDSKFRSCAAGKAANKYVNVNASSISDTASTNRGYRSLTNLFKLYVGKIELILCASFVSFRPAARRTYKNNEFVNAADLV